MVFFSRKGLGREEGGNVIEFLTGVQVEMHIKNMHFKTDFNPNFLPCSRGKM